MKLRQPLLLTIIILTLSGNNSNSFSLLGPFPDWQVTRIGYQLPGDVGGPMVVGEEYRFNLKTITYACSPEFVNWFGQSGISAVDEAIAMFENLGDLSVVDPNSYPLTSERFNATAFQLNLTDLKSEAMALIIESLGLADPERYIRTLRELEVIEDPVRRYYVINRNYDPITYQPSDHINGHLYTYTTIFDDDTTAFPIITAVDPLAELSSPVASFENKSYRGRYYSSLTRDDVGGLKYIYRSDNYNVETLPAGTGPATQGGEGVTALTGGSTPWTPVLPNLTNQVTTVNTNLVDRGLRGGIGRPNFTKLEYDQSFGDFIPVTVRDTDVVITNGLPVRQIVERTIAASADLTFDVADLIDALNQRAPEFTNFDPISGVVGDYGPGAITANLMTFNRLEPGWTNFSPFSLSQEDANQNLVWGSFDGTDQAPVIYPNFLSINLLEQLTSSAAGSGSTWIPVVGAPVADPNAQNNTGVTNP